MMDNLTVGSRLGWVKSRGGGWMETIERCRGVNSLLRMKRRFRGMNQDVGKAKELGSQ